MDLLWDELEATQEQIDRWNKEYQDCKDRENEELSEYWGF